MESCPCTIGNNSDRKKEENNDQCNMKKDASKFLIYSFKNTRARHKKRVCYFSRIDLILIRLLLSSNLFSLFILFHSFNSVFVMHIHIGLLYRFILYYIILRKKKYRKWEEKKNPRGDMKNPSRKYFEKKNWLKKSVWKFF